MVLVEEMVSRKHARILVRGGGLFIEDLGSTNGTFVNGEKIARAQLKEGDRVLIGTSILKVVPATALNTESRRNLEGLAVRRVTTRQRSSGDEAPRMSGALEEIPLPDLLQLFGTSRKSGVLVLRTESRIGRIFLKQGLLHFAQIEGQPEISALKCIYRMLGWRSGHFELEPPQERSIDAPLDVSVQEALMEGFRQQDELGALLGRLPAVEARLVLRTPLAAPLSDLEPQHLEVLQEALNSRSFAALLDRSRLTDLQTAEVVDALMKRGYLQSS